MFYGTFKKWKGATMKLPKFLQLNKRNMVDETAVSDVLLSALLSGTPIKREDALTLPAVSGAVDTITGMIASMPVKLYKRKKGVVESVDDDIRVGLFNGDTGDTLDGFQIGRAHV